MWNFFEKLLKWADNWMRSDFQMFLRFLVVLGLVTAIVVTLAIVL